jgi:transcriptional regulator with PAS, ATPase and Fis domain
MWDAGGVSVALVSANMQTSETILVGNSAATADLRRQIAIAARSDAKILILGETGAGKEVVARSIHDQSGRRSRPFIAVNCSGIPETLLESELFGHMRGSFTGAYRDKPGLIRQANGGTLFLDELGEMSLRMQAMLLRFTESGEIHPVGAERPAPPSNVRLITATNRDLRAQIDAGAFRQDLYYRLNVIEILVAPLRDRRDDVLPLLEHFLHHASAAHAASLPMLAATAEGALREYAWPGNVRELRNIAERLVLAGHQHPIEAADLPVEVRTGVVRTAAATQNPTAGESAPAVADASVPSAVEAMFGRFAAGENFWVVVHEPFKQHELTTRDLMALIDAGLRSTRGSYRGLLKLFNLPASDYKRLHAFLYARKCNLPVGPYRRRQPGMLRTIAKPYDRAAVA